MKDMLKANFGSPDSPIRIGEIDIPCYVLENEKRVITQRGLLKALGMSVGSSGNRGGDRLVKFLGQSRFNDYVSNELRMMTSYPIKFRASQGGGIAFGYEATILVDICDLVIQAKKDGKLLKMQEHIADRAELLIRAFAKTGIIALVDEATGFQVVRERDALKKFLEKFLQEERGKWVRTFPPEFFEAIFKMKGWTWKEANGGKTPRVVGHYINNFVYSRLAPKVLDELRVRNPKDDKGNRKGKHPQWINPDFGHPKLKEHLTVLTAFAKAAGYNWLNWERMVNRALPKFESDGSAKQELEFPE
jgi:hypothetical protein